MRSSVLIPPHPPPLLNVCVQCHPKAHFPEIRLIVLHDHTTKQLFIFGEYAVQECLCMWGLILLLGAVCRLFPQIYYSKTKAGPQKILSTKIGFFFNGNCEDKK